jgi:hypothetical protein
LQIGASDVFGLAPQFVHRVEFRCPLGQPQQFDVQVAGQLS